MVSYESIHDWGLAGCSQQAEAAPATTGRQWIMDEVFIRIRGKQHYLGRAVDQDGAAKLGNQATDFAASPAQDHTTLQDALQ